MFAFLTYLSLNDNSGSGLVEANLGHGDEGPAISGDDVLVSATLSPGKKSLSTGN